MKNPIRLVLPLRPWDGDLTPGSIASAGWQVVTSDNPWSFNDKGSRIAPDQRRKRFGRKGYRTLTVEQLCAMPVREVVDRDAILFLWTTSAHLVDGSATRVCRAWGFEPKTTIVWVKGRWVSTPFALVRELAALLRDGTVFPWLDARRLVAKIVGAVQELVLQIGMGHFTRGAHELVVVATRGRATRLVADRGVPSVIIAPRGKHSAKPEAFRDLVDRLTGRRPVLELFARSARPGWTAWGDQAPGAEKRCG